MILTDGKGRPFRYPDPPPADATIDDKIAYLRAVAAYNDAVASCAGAAFSKQFHRSMK